MIHLFSIVVSIAWSSSASAGWQEALVPALDAAPAEVVAAIDEAQPRVTRAGTLMFQDPIFEADGALPVLLNRLALGADDTPTRVALAGALVRLQRSGGDWTAAWADLALTDAEPEVRAVLVGGLRRAPSPLAASVLPEAFRDADHEVRAEAAAAAGWQLELALTGPLMHALDDPSASVRASAAQSLGWHAHQPAMSKLHVLVEDSDATVVKRAQGALRRLQ
jgi:HEAT repeat protein